MEVIIMPNAGGFGRGFGFRGYSPPWPYVGRGRGGLPRCWAYTPYPSYGGTPESGGYPYVGMGYPYPGGYGASGMPFFASPLSPDQELEFLKNQAGMLKQEMELIEARVKDLENKKAPA
jgi:hypothetical protein